MPHVTTPSDPVLTASTTEAMEQAELDQALDTFDDQGLPASPMASTTEALLATTSQGDKPFHYTISFEKSNTRGRNQPMDTDKGPDKFGSSTDHPA